MTSRTSTQATIADALHDAGITLRRADIVVPDPATRLTPGMHVYITYARRIHVHVARADVEVFTQAATVGEALTAAGFDPQPQDIVRPARSKPIANGMVVSLGTIRDVQLTQDSPIPFATVYRYDATRADGTTTVTQAGTEGYVHHEYRVKRVNGQEIAREEIAKTTVAPVAQVITIGTYVPAPQPQQQAPDGGACSQTVSVWSTYYTAASAGGSTTATGTGVYKGIIAVDPRYIPLGTRMYVPGYGYGVAADTGGGVKGWWIDVAYGASDARDWYSHYVDICILG